MRVIHFTVGAGDPLWGRGVRGADFVPLLEGDAAMLVGCLHLTAKSFFEDAGVENARALMVVSGRATLVIPGLIDLGGGVGVVTERGERVRLESEEGAVLLIIDCACLRATEHAISNPNRISGQRWPGEPPAGC